METVEKKENQITFKADIEDSLANAIRRYLNQILVLAIDEVEISKNGSALYDEVVAHRIGLVPLKMSKAVSEKTTANLKLSSKKEGMVKSEGLKGSVDPVSTEVPITFLDKGQEIELIANVRAGKGAEHIKFSPGLMFYRNISEITLDKNLVEEVKKVCPDCDVKEKGDKIVITDDKKSEVADVVEGIANKAGKKAEVDVKNELILTLESFGQMDIKDIFKKSVDALKKDLAEVSKKIK
jgi:DNA-directed RNA polymerase subunit D